LRESEIYSNRDMLGSFERERHARLLRMREIKIYMQGSVERHRERVRDARLL